MEIGPTYSIGHLIKLNAFINPFNDDENSIDNYVNQVIINISKQHKILSCVKRIPTNIDSSKFPNNVEKILELPSKTSIFDYSIEDDKKKEALSSVEQNEVRRCIHALLKNDWDNIT
ncbi:hypothetical protein [Ligilactobacillus apodemi]|uniref:hypothetical protein n=1 Tax=Ligilactobacillus apodemi TaxID=307126 RepID=UPI00214BB21D|nr:hypothetical protein [Ligilactobacillus apodemi]MCR1901112.1 hypothetical protein [Ligilactobacillus apodemi]